MVECRVSFFILILLPFEINCEIDSAMVESVVKYYGKGTIVSTFLCNRKDQISVFKNLVNTYPVQINTLQSDLFKHPTSPNHMLYVLDLDCPNSKEFLKKVDGYRFFGGHYKWLISYKDNGLINGIIENYFKFINILVDSDVNLASDKGIDFITVKKIFKYHKNDTQLNFENMGTWQQYKGFIPVENLEIVTAKRRQNLKGAPLRISCVITDPDSFNHLTDRRRSHIDTDSKLNYNIGIHLFHALNASENFVFHDNFGYKSNNYTGMIGNVSIGNSDLAGTAYFVTDDRIDQLDNIFTTTPTDVRFILRQPKLSYVTNIFLLPFDKVVWKSTIALIFVMTGAMYLVIKWEATKMRISRNENEGNNVDDRSWNEILLMSFGAFCQQGSTSVPKSIPGRITTIILFISFMFIFTSYSACIVALLQSNSNSIQTLEDLLKSSLDVGVDDTLYNRYFFPHETEPIRHALYVQKIAPPGQKPKFCDLREGVMKLKRGLYAFHVELGIAYKFVSDTFKEDEKCGLHEIQFIQSPYPLTGATKNSSYKEHLKIAYNRLQENGMLGREFRMMYTKKPQCISSGSYVTIGLVDCYEPFVMLIGGTTFSIILMVFEKFVKKYRCLTK